jgi:hypothetical protein
MIGVLIIIVVGVTPQRVVILAKRVSLKMLKDLGLRTQVMILRTEDGQSWF